MVWSNAFALNTAIRLAEPIGGIVPDDGITIIPDGVVATVTGDGDGEGAARRSDRFEAVLERLEAESGIRDRAS
ncbi:hypothetical protein ACNS7O_02230 [Haloferacaceae archaeon DSL9]